MKKLTNWILGAIGIAGGYLVTEGVVTGEELGNIQNVIGMSLAGGALSIGTIITVVKAIPAQLVSAGYNKAVEKYGAEAVNGFIGKVHDIQNAQEELKQLTSEVKVLLEEAKEARETLLNE